MFHHRFGGLPSDTAHWLAANPYTAMNVLDDLVGPSNSNLFYPLAAFSAAKAQRGEKLPTLVSEAAGVAALRPMAWVAHEALSTIAGGPALWMGVVVLTAAPNTLLRHSVYRGLRYLHDFDRRTRRLEMGGRYTDSETNQALRASSIQEMSAAFGSARRYLGNEAALMHQ